MAHQPSEPAKQGILRRIFGRHNFNDNSIPEPNDPSPKAAPEPKPDNQEPEMGTEPEGDEHPDESVPPSHDASTRPGSSRRTSYNVVPGLPRAQTFKRQQSEQRTHLEPVQPTPDERRALSVDRRSMGRQHSPISRILHNNPRVSAPGILGPDHSAPIQALSFAERSQSRPRADQFEKQPVTMPHMFDDLSSAFHDTDHNNVPSMTGTHSVADSGNDEDDIIARELDTKWILNLSMHFRDRSKREKFFVTYRQEPHTWRRVTISLDYRNAPPGSLESQLDRTRYQRDKIAKIYEAIRESLEDIQFYDTVTNLKLQTVDGRLYVHVMEDGNEIIRYPPVHEVRHLQCTQVRERDIVFDSHMSGFVYKVRVGDKTLIKKEIPSPETVDEFLYEINALSALRDCPNVIDFYGVVVDDHSHLVKGLLIDYADRGTLIDILYEHREHNILLPWATREKWARQIVQGLADVHESGFVQGDFTLSNIVITKDDDARIIDINRRGCPVGWEPPEAAPLIESGHRIAMYIGVKSDLYQLGMVLWAIAVLEDEPEMRGRPLFLGPEDNIPDWYRRLTEICLSSEPKARLQAVVLLGMFPPLQERKQPTPRPPMLHAESTLRPSNRTRSPSEERRSGLVAQPSSEWSHVSRTFTGSGTRDYGSSYYPPRGRSPPSRQPSTPGDYISSRHMSHRTAAWCDDVESVARSRYSDEDVFFHHEKPDHDMSDLPSVDTGHLLMDQSSQTLKADVISDDTAEMDGRNAQPYGAPQDGLEGKCFSGVPELLVNEPSPIDQGDYKKSMVASSHPAPEARGFQPLDRSDEVAQPKMPTHPAQVLSDDGHLLESENLAMAPKATLTSLDTITAQDPKTLSQQSPLTSLANPGIPVASESIGLLNTNVQAQLPTLAEPQPQIPTSRGQDTLMDLTAGPQQPQDSYGPDMPSPAQDQAAVGEILTNDPRIGGGPIQPSQSSSAPISRRVTDESVATLPHGKPSSDGVATLATSQAPRSSDPGPPATMSLNDMSDCLAGIGGGLSDALMERGSFDDDFSILGRPPHLMISTDGHTR
ncbi:hypothetical protein NLU13_0747 [Sarocladium strictum]|uniref:Protein kinase domain-containing protein n=1 Tax=Sarocladium strictum TaxID=5046 RepID=A0AA39LB34_SARSR|nr:hypothetical protein NLU13_0747 [Sarocladium strictum]